MCKCEYHASLRVFKIQIFTARRKIQRFRRNGKRKASDVESLLRTLYNLEDQREKLKQQLRNSVGFVPNQVEGAEEGGAEEGGAEEEGAEEEDDANEAAVTVGYLPVRSPYAMLSLLGLKRFEYRTLKSFNNDSKFKGMWLLLRESKTEGRCLGAVRLGNKVETADNKDKSVYNRVYGWKVRNKRKNKNFAYPIEDIKVFKTAFYIKNPKAAESICELKTESEMARALQAIKLGSFQATNGEVLDLLRSELKRTYTVRQTEQTNKEVQIIRSMFP